MRPARRLVMLLCLAACSGSDAGSTPDAQPSVDARDPTLLWVAGTYGTQVALLSSSCDGITVMNMGTQVAHVPGASAVTLTHAGIGHTGTVERDGTFVTGARAVQVGQTTHTLTIEGTFGTAGFDATVSAAVTRAGVAECAYSVGWTGTKSGEPNVIPGV